ncbi:MAG TPA: hypothetical protein PLU22_21420 [Polyangiaceae bacterium]|mgnify:CR=1 FL=1|nr:hypothetical protein [Polyangiaceae bacterium]
MLELWGDHGGIAIVVAAVEALALVVLLLRPGRRGGSSLVADATRLGLRARTSHR